jgi:hypothetical protein
MPVNSLHGTYLKVQDQWSRCRDAYSGSDAVKLRASLYLPLLEGQTNTSDGPYGGYKTRALFYPAMSRTVSGLTGVVFGKPFTVSGIPATYEKHFDDVTLTGISLESYAIEHCMECLIVGRIGTLVDMPDERIPNARPYWSSYYAENILNWRVERIDGRKQLTLLVLQEQIEVYTAKDPFVPETRTQYRVLRLTDRQYTVQLYTEDTDKPGTFLEGNLFVPVRRGKPLNYIPFVFFGPTGIDPDIAHPPLLDLVDVNLSHYRTSADQEHGAHFTALPTPWIAGHDFPPGETSLSIGSGKAWVLSAGATVGMLEFSGAGLAALKDIKEEKRQLMVTLGARMLETQKNGVEAAETLGMRHAGERSSLSILSSALGQALTTAVRWHLYWMGVDEKVADKALVEINPDVMEKLTAEDINTLVSAWQAGAISFKTLHYNLAWGEWTRPGIDVEEELQDIEDETPDDAPEIIPGVVPLPVAKPAIVPPNET